MPRTAKPHPTPSGPVSGSRLIAFPGGVPGAPQPPKAGADDKGLDRGPKLQYAGTFAEFDGHGYVAVDRLQGMSVDELTISFWVKWRDPIESDAVYIKSVDGIDIRTSASRATLFNINHAFDSSQERGTAIWLEDVKNLRLHVGYGSAATRLNIADGDWHHLAIHLKRKPRSTSYAAVVSQDGGAKEWRGEIRAENPLTPDAALHLGGRYFDEPDQDDGFTGWMAHFQVFNGARAPGEYRRSMFSQSPPNTKKMILSLPLDRGSQKRGRFADLAGRQRHVRARVKWGQTPWIGWSNFDFARYGFDLRHAYLQDAHLVKANLKGLDLSDADLRGATLDSPNLESAKLRDADLVQTVFRAPNLKKADLRGATLTAMEIQGPKNGLCDLTATRFDPTLKGRDFGREHPQIALVRCRIPFAVIDKDWRNLNLAGSVIPRAQLPKELCKLKASHSDLSGFDLSGRKLAEASFVGAILDDANLSGCDLRKADFSHARLQRAELAKIKGSEDTRFDHAILRGANLAGAYLEDASFVSAVLGENVGKTKDVQSVNAANLSHALLIGAAFTQAQLVGVDFSYAWLEGADLDDVNLHSSVFANAFLQGAAFEKANLQGASFSGAFLVDARFNGVDLSALLGSSGFANAFLQGADFTGAKLFGVNLDGALFSSRPSTTRTGCVVKIEHEELEKELGTDTLEYGYRKTAFSVGQTNRQTTCPDGSKGPCKPVTWQIAEGGETWIFKGPRRKKGPRKKKGSSGS